MEVKAKGTGKAYDFALLFVYLFACGAGCQNDTVYLSQTQMVQLRSE